MTGGIEKKSNFVFYMTFQNNYEEVDQKAFLFLKSLLIDF